MWGVLAFLVDLRQGVVFSGLPSVVPSVVLSIWELFGSLTETCDGFVTGLCDLPTGSSVTGLNLLRWNTLCVFHLEGSCILYVRGPVTSVIGNGPYRRTSNLGDGQSVRRSFELTQTCVPTSSGGVSVVLLPYCSTC